MNIPEDASLLGSEGGREVRAQAKGCVSGLLRTRQSSWNIFLEPPGGAHFLPTTWILARRERIRKSDPWPPGGYENDAGWIALSVLICYSTETNERGRSKGAARCWDGLMEREAGKVEWSCRGQGSRALEQSSAVLSPQTIWISTEGLNNSTCENNVKWVTGFSAVVDVRVTKCDRIDYSSLISFKEIWPYI